MSDSPETLPASPSSPIENLRLILTESRALISPETLYHKFTHRHADRVANLAADVESLIATGRFEAAALIVRSMLESIFNIVAAARLRDEFVKQKTLYEVRSWIRYAGKISPDPNGVVKLAIDRMRQLEGELLSQFQPTSSFPKQDAWDCAVAAQHEDVYREIYFSLSLHTHASTLGKLVRDAGVDETLIRNTLSYCVVIASQQLLTVFNPGDRAQQLAQLEILAAKFKQWLLGNPY
jgi:hypothetical protein